MRRAGPEVVLALLCTRFFLAEGACFIVAKFTFTESNKTGETAGVFSPELCEEACSKQLNCQIYNFNWLAQACEFGTVTTGIQTGHDKYHSGVRCTTTASSIPSATPATESGAEHRVLAQSPGTSMDGFAAATTVTGGSRAWNFQSAAMTTTVSTSTAQPKAPTTTVVRELPPTHTPVWHVQTPTATTRTTLATTTLASTSTFTRTVTSSTTAASTTAAPIVSSNTTAEDLIKMAENKEAQLLSDIWSSGQRTVRAETAVAKTAVFKLGTSGAPTALPLEGTGVKVMIPGSALAGKGEVAAAVSVFKLDALSYMTTGDKDKGNSISSPTPLSAMSMGLHSRDGEIKVKGLQEPILVNLPTLSTEATCAYWDDERKIWSSEGVEERRSATGALVCATTHLSLFAAVLRGFLNALKCSNLSLLNGKAIVEVFSFSWMGTPIALLFWLLLLVIIACFVLACKLDGDRSVKWTDEVFLIPVAHAEVEIKKGPGTFAKVKKAIKVLMGKGGGEEEKDTEAAEDVKEAKEKEKQELAKSVADKLVNMSLKRQTSYNLWLSDQAVDFLVADKSFHALLGAAANARGSVEATEGEKAWYELHQSVIDSMKTQWGHLGGWRSVPWVAGRIFLEACPLVSVYLLCPFKSSSQRLLLLSCKLFGSLMIGALFFQASGGFQDKASPKECSPQDVGEMIGRILAIGIASTLFAAVPVMGLNKLHTRKLTSVDAVGSEQWNNILAKWKSQDNIFWAAGLCYISFCLSFIILFIANLNENDQWSWGTSGLTSMMKDNVIIPLCIGFLIPMVATAVLKIFAELMKGIDRIAQLEGRRIVFGQRKDSDSHTGGSPKRTWGDLGLDFGLTRSGTNASCNEGKTNRTNSLKSGDSEHNPPPAPPPPEY